MRSLRALLAVVPSVTGSLSNTLFDSNPDVYSDQEWANEMYENAHSLPRNEPVAIPFNQQEAPIHGHVHVEDAEEEQVLVSTDSSAAQFIPLGLIGYTLPFMDRVDTLQLLSSLLLEEEPENRTIEQLPVMFLTENETIRYLTDHAVFEVVNKFATNPTIFPVDRDGGLDLSHRQVTALTPAFSRLTNLEMLDLSHTHVADIRPLHALTYLSWLNLSQTAVADIGPLQSLTRLWRLDLSHTPVSDIRPLHALTNLRELDLSHTPVADIRPLQSLTNLRELDLSHTPVADIGPLQSLTDLWYLYLSHTDVTDLRPLSNIRPYVYILQSVQQQKARQAIAEAANSQLGLWSQVKLFEPFILPSSANENTTIGRMGDYDVMSSRVLAGINVYLRRSVNRVPINEH